MRKLPVVFFAILLSYSFVLTQVLPDYFSVENAVSEATFELVVGMAFAPDGRFFVIEKRGRVYLVENDLKQEPAFLNLEKEVFDIGEMGLLGIAVDPNFDNNGYFYLLYSVDPNQDGIDDEAEGTFERLTRYSVKPDNRNEVDLTSRRVLIGSEWSSGIPLCHLSHAGGAIRFGTDGTLLLSTGDGATFLGTDTGGATPDCFTPGRIDSSEDIGRFRAQSLTSLSGKILRIDPETGAGLPSNPYFTGEVNDNQSKVWAYGLRNPFRFEVRNNGSSDPALGQPGSVYVGDVGDGLFEDLHVSTSGGENFGWPCYEGPQTTSLIDSARCANMGSLGNPRLHSPPIVTIHHTAAEKSSPPGVTGKVIVAGAFYTGADYPVEYQNSFFFGDYINGWVHVLQVDEEDNPSAVLDFAQLSHWSAVDMQPHPITGDIHFVHLSGQTVYRIRYTGTVSVESPENIPTKFVLFQNYPNPFNPTTTISYQIGAETEVALTIYNQVGQEVKTWGEQKKPAGVYQVAWRGRDNAGKEVGSGVYLFRVKTDRFVKTRKLILLR